MNESGGWFSDERERVFYAPAESVQRQFAMRLSEMTALAAWCGQFWGNTALFAGWLILIARPLAMRTGTMSEIADGNLDNRAENKGQEHV